MPNTESLLLIKWGKTYYDMYFSYEWIATISQYKSVIYSSKFCRMALSVYLHVFVQMILVSFSNLPKRKRDIFLFSNLKKTKLINITRLKM